MFLLVELAIRCKKIGGFGPPKPPCFNWHEKELLNGGFFLLPSSDKVFVIILKHTFGKSTLQLSKIPWIFKLKNLFSACR